MLEIIFFASVLSVFFAYFGYPFSLFIFSLIQSKTVVKADYLPAVTFLITACNEEKRIRQKLDNTLKLEYPQTILQILVASDGSTDRTNQIVNEYFDKGIELLQVQSRKGKENAQKEAVKAARGEILVFSDVATVLDYDALKEITSNFADPTVGCVSSEDRLLDRDGKPCGEGFYVRYEMLLRRLETKVNSLVGLSGSFFAARKEVCRDFSSNMQSDFRTVLNAVKMGLRGVSDSKSIGYYHDISDQKREFDRKVRTVLRGLAVFFNHLEFLNVFRYGLFSYQYFCHKLLRWLVPFFLILAAATNLLLAFNSIWFFALFICQIAFYGTAVWLQHADNLTVHPVLKIPLYFSTVNLAILMAWWSYFRGHRVVMWTPSER